jgi:hypothetical protein
MSGGVVIVLTAGGAALIVAAVWARSSRLIAWGLAALGSAYVVGVPSGRAVWVTTPLVAAALLALGEAAFYGAERASGTEYSGRQAARVLLAALAGLAISAVVLLAATIAIRSSLVLTLAGILAAVIAIALPSTRFRRRM